MSVKRVAAPFLLLAAACRSGSPYVVTVRADPTRDFATTWDDPARDTGFVSEAPEPDAPPLRLDATILVLDLKTLGGVDASVGILMTKQLLTRLEEVQGVKTVSVEDVDTMLNVEKQKDALGCASTACAAEIGGALGTDYVVYGQVGRLGDQYNLNLTAVASKKNVVSARMSELMPADENELASRLPGIARELINKIAGGGSAR